MKLIKKRKDETSDEFIIGGTSDQKAYFDFERMKKENNSKPKVNSFQSNQILSNEFKIQAFQN